MSRQITFNCGGEQFTVSKDLIDKFKDSMLYTLVNGPFKESTQDEIFLDKDPITFRAILNFMRNDELFIPPGISTDEMQFELDYYNIKTVEIVPKGKIWSKNGVIGLAENVCDSFLNHQDFLSQIKTANIIKWRIYSLPENYKGEYSQFNCFISACLDIIVIYMKNVHEIAVNDKVSVGHVPIKDNIYFYYNNEKIKFNTKDLNESAVCKTLILSPIYNPN